MRRSTAISRWACCGASTTSHASSSATSIDVLFGFADRLDRARHHPLQRRVFYCVVHGPAGAGSEIHFQAPDAHPSPVIGVVWFSLADYQNALWAFQVSWYLTVFFFVMMLCALLLPEDRRPLWFAVSRRFWPSPPRSRPSRGSCAGPSVQSASSGHLVASGTPEIAIWLGAMIVTIGLYLHGYRFNEGNICFARTSAPPVSSCTTPRPCWGSSSPSSET